MNKFETHQGSRLWLAALLIPLLVAACGGGGGGDPTINGGIPAGAIAPGAVCSSAGPTIPILTSSEPTNGNQFASISTTSVAPSKLITASFSLAMDPATLNSAPAGTLPTFTVREYFSGANVPGTVAMNAGPPPAGSVPANMVATYTTTAALSGNTTYTVIVTPAAKSAVGVAMGCTYAWTFKTAPPAGVGATDLGILGPFGIASAGGITNTGATKINGDVVLNPNDTCNAAAVGAGDNFGACGGNPLNVPTNNVGDKVITQIHPDTTTADAVRAVLLAKWNSISPAGTPGATILPCGIIGSTGGCPGPTTTLTPGVYATGSTIGVTGTLTLDALGDSNAVWVFQAPTALTAFGSTIILANGAKASNVWWFVGSSATLNAGTTFMGNILASASISMGVGSTSCGRLLAGAEGSGTFAFLNNIVSVPSHPNAPVGCI